MPADEDYNNRRQQISLQHGSPSPAPAACPAGCPAATVDHLQYVASSSDLRYASEKNLQADHYETPTDSFASERGSSDRLASGERYQGVSERYPLGERPHTSVSSERLAQKEAAQGHDRQPFVPERYQYGASQKYSDRMVPVQNVGSLDRYHNHTSLDRYQRTNTPTERYHTLSSTDKERCSSSAGRCTPVEKYSTQTVEIYGTTERYNPNRSSQTERDQYSEGASQKGDVYGKRKSERYLLQNRYNHEQYLHERFPAIPCPERFATDERVSFTQVPYMEPPSPAPANDRFIPPPPLSPDHGQSPDCFPSNPFPSPTTSSVPPPDRFIPPPPLSPSPTETYSPKKIKSRERYDRYVGPNDRFFVQCQTDRFKDRGHYYAPQEKYCHQSVYHQNDKYVNVPDRYSNNDRYIPPNAHMPVERYIPQPQEYYGTYQTFDRFAKFSGSDPYMRRDLTFHYRLPLPYPTNQYQRMRYAAAPNRAKCCQYQDGYHLSKSSPGSSSSSSVTSQGKEIQQKENAECQNYQGCAYQQQQEKAIQCGSFTNKELQCFQNKDKECGGFLSANVLAAKGQCRHVICASPSVEYVGQSGGRHVCATPPLRGSIGSGDSVCMDQCCNRRAQNTLSVAVWRATPTNQQQQQTSQHHQAGQHSPPQPPSNNASSSGSQDQASEELSTTMSDINHSEQRTNTPSSQEQTSSPKPPPVQRAVSMPATMASPPLERYRPMQQISHTQSARLNSERPVFARSTSRKEAIKNYIKKETATFFGVDEESEEGQLQKWRDRRKRLASRTYGALKDEYRVPSERTLQRSVSEVAASRSAAMRTPRLSAGRPDVLPGTSDMADSGTPDLYATTGIRRKDSVARMTWDGISYVVSTLTRHRPRPRQARLSRSFPPETPSNLPSSPEEEGFFVLPPKTAEDELDRAEELSALPQGEPVQRFRGTEFSGWLRPTRDVSRELERGARPTVGRTRISSSLLDRVLDNSNRREYGMGWVGKMFGRRLRTSVTEDDDVVQQLDDIEDHRPLFTYWVTTVHILVLLISLICYGFGPFGIDLKSRSGQVLVTSLSLQQVDYMEPANFWLGPRAADLIHLGAKFGPCMRVDNKIIQQIDKTKAKERDTACCIRNDDSGCVQSSQADCSKTISTWKKWSAGDSGPGGRISGSVCGLDPKFCDAPASVHPYEWPDDITKWPICRKTNTQFSTQKRLGSKDKLAEHMVCEVIGHPCCIGIHGKCRITTREYCDFVRGTFHEEASLCSQVSCLNDVCGMVPFYFPQTPDQFYRVLTSLFLHAGILQLLISVLIQYFMMRDLEKLTGSLRIGIIYIGSGVAGNLASAIFIPYRADVGPAGSQFGLLACLIVEVLNAWPMLKNPKKALSKLLFITGVLFIIGLLPWVDNYAHLFGFIFGFLLSYALLPFISFGAYDRQKKIALIWVCLLSAGFLFICLILFFYIIPVYDCKVCSYLNCLPLTQDFCASQNINFRREEPVV